MRTVLIDGSGFVYRAFYKLPALVKSDGTQVGAVYGYCDMLQQLIDKETHNCTHMAVVLDGGRSGRTEIYPAYKGNRKARPPELIEQIGMLPDATASHSMTSIKVAGYEADDVIGTYAHDISAAGGEVVIYSSDKDLIPLLALDGVSITDPLKKQVITPVVCAERFGVTPEQMTDYLSLVGDASDNIPGVAKIGAKGAASLLQVHGDLDTILHLAAEAPHHLTCSAAQRTSLRDNAADARLSRDLVKLRHVADVPDIDAAAWQGFDPDRLLAYLREMEFALLLRAVEEKCGMAA